MKFIYLNGELVPSDQPCLSPADQGFLAGHGLFETIRVEAGRPLAFKYHFERFHLSAKKLGLTPLRAEELEMAIGELVSKNQVSDARLRITMTAGDLIAPTLLITLATLPTYSESVVVITVPFVRNEKSALSGIKSTSYAENILALQYAKDRGADEAIFCNTKGSLCEGATTNVFVIVEDRILTPPLSAGCLPGTSRRIILELGKSLRLAALEEEIPFPIGEIEFAFLTSSLRGLQPIRRFDDQMLPINHPAFAQLQNAYPAAVKAI